MPPREDVRAFLEAHGSARAFPDEALLDEAVARDYLARARTPPALLHTRPPDTAGQVVVGDEVIPQGPRVRIYRAKPLTSGAQVVFFHGGGWVFGDLDTHDSICRRLAVLAGCSVISVDYRLAPEYPYPAALDDAYRAVCWVDEQGGGSADLVVAGTSSGGNLAAAVALKARDENGPRIRLQLLVYPALDSVMGTPSHRENARGYGLGHNQMRWFWEQYVPDAAMREEPFASPAHAATLSGLPQAVVVSAEYDPLRDEAEEYARRLGEDGVEVEYIDYPGQVHGFASWHEEFEDAQDVMARLARRVQER